MVAAGGAGVPAATGGQDGAAAGGGHTSASGGRTMAAGGAGVGALAHAASRRATAAAGRRFDDNGNTRDSKEKAVGWVFLEIVAALAIAVAIVWWTFPKKPPDAGTPREGKDAE